MAIHYKVPYALAVYGQEEIDAVNTVLKSGNTMMGPAVREFETRVAALFGKKHGIMVNSGSSANYLAFDVLKLPPGSEVITPIVTFSTTVAPIVKNGLVPVFVDVKMGSYLIDVEKIEELITPSTKALMIPSLMGNVPDYVKLRDIADRRGLWLIEDSCDTLGATLKGKPTGQWSHISTTSFYGSHIITAGGGGGMICVNDPSWDRNCRVLRGWGRASEVASDDIEERFRAKIDDMPYDAKFVFEEIGYNFLPLEMSAAFGMAQLNKLPAFTATRQKNFSELRSFFSAYDKFFHLPEQPQNVKTNWLAFPLTLKDTPFTRLELVKYLEAAGIQTRPLFTGNIMRQPGFRGIRNRMAGSYPVADMIMRNSVVIGCHHGMDNERMDYMKKTFAEFLDKY